jgi:hypothetical protein
MPITLVLTDDQALDIVSQVSSMLRKRSSFVDAPISPRLSRHTAASLTGKVREYIASKGPGEVFHVGALYDLFAKEGIQRNTISCAIKLIRKQPGVLHMISRGTYEIL